MRAFLLPEGKVCARVGMPEARPDSIRYLSPVRSAKGGSYPVPRLAQVRGGWLSVNGRGYQVPLDSINTIFIYLCQRKSSINISTEVYENGIDLQGGSYEH